MKIRKDMNVEVPRVPNFILAGSDSKIAICDMTDDVLIAIADEWKKALLKRAKEQREARKH